MCATCRLLSQFWFQNITWQNKKLYSIMLTHGSKNKVPWQDLLLDVLDGLVGRCAALFEVYRRTRKDRLRQAYTPCYTRKARYDAGLDACLVQALKFHLSSCVFQDPLNLSCQMLKWTKLLHAWMCFDVCFESGGIGISPKLDANPEILLPKKAASISTNILGWCCHATLLIVIGD